MSVKAHTIKPTIRLSCRALSHAYQELIALSSIELDQEGPCCVALIGANGAGKSTLLRGLVGAQRLSEGEIELDGELIYPESPTRSELGYLSERTPLPSELSVIEVLRGASSIHRISRKDRKEMIERSIVECDLNALLDRRCETLSRGQRQRVGLATAIIHRPKLLVLDEVHSGLDPLQTREINGVLRSLAQRSLLILSTHRLSAAEQIADHYWVLHQGEMLTSISRETWMSRWNQAHREEWSLERAYLELISSDQDHMST